MDKIYDVVSAGTEIIFLQEVNRILELGFKLQGGVAVYDGYYYQAVVKDLEDYENITNEKA